MPENDADTKNVIEQNKKNKKIGANLKWKNKNKTINLRQD